MAPVDPNILQALRSPDEENRKRAIFLAAQSLEFRAIPALTKIANEDPAIELRYFAKKALFFLQQNSMRRGRPGAEGAAQPAAGPEAAPARLEQLRRDLASPDPQMRNKVVQAVVRIGGPRALELVLERAAAEEDPFVKATLAISVGILGGPPQVQVLERFLQDPNPRVRANAIEGLMHLDLPEAARLITPHLKDKDNRVKVNAYTALGRLKKLDLLKALSEMLSSDKVWMRDSATYALVKLEIPESVPLLEAALTDSYRGIRLKARNGLVILARKGAAQALRALEKVGGTRERPEDFLTLEILDRTSPDQGLEQASADGRLDAVRRIMEAKDKDKVDALRTRLVVESDPKVAATLVSALGALGDRRSLGALATQLASGDRRVRANAVEAIGLIGGDGTRDLLGPFLADPDNRVRANAVVALRATEGVDVHGPLAGMAQAPEELMRLSAVYALLVLRDERLLPVLEGLLGDPVPRVRKKAIDSLKILSAEGLPAAADCLRRAGIAAEGLDLAAS